MRGARPALLLLAPLLLCAPSLDEIARRAEALAREAEACGQDAACLADVARRLQALRGPAGASPELASAATPCLGFEAGSVPGPEAGGRVECLPLRIHIRDTSWWERAGCTNGDERFDIAYDFDVEGQLIRDTSRGTFVLTTLPAVPARASWSLDVSSVGLRVTDFGADCAVRGTSRFGEADLDFGAQPSVRLAYDHGTARGPGGGPPGEDVAFFSPLVAWGSTALAEATWGIGIPHQVGPIGLDGGALREAGLRLGPGDVDRLFAGGSLRREVVWSGRSPGKAGGSGMTGGTRLSIDVVAATAATRCRLAITSPARGERFAFSKANRGEIDLQLKASVAPARFASGVRWTLPTLDPGTAVAATPASLRGAAVAVKLTGLPGDVSGLGEKTITARIDDPGCRAQASTAVKLFFPRDAKNHPGAGSGKTPNWFHYWKQTKAAFPKGQRVVLAYGARTFDECRKPATAAVYHRRFGYKTLYVCDLATFTPPFRLVLPVIDRQSAAKVTGTRTTRGIETFAVAVRHEFEHFLVDHNLWSGVALADRPTQDRDGDGLPDRLEPGLGFDPKRFQTWLGSHPKWKGIGGDEEWMAHETQKDVAPGSVDKLDWGHPGARWP